MGKNLVPIQGMQEARDIILIPGVEDPLIRKWQPTQVFLSVKSYGQRSLVGYSPQCNIETDVTKHSQTKEESRKLDSSLSTV